MLAGEERILFAGVVVSLVTFRVNGRQVWRSFPTKTQAEVYLAKTSAEVARGEFKAPDKVSFAEAAETWYRHGVHVGGRPGAVEALDRPRLCIGSEPLAAPGVRPTDPAAAALEDAAPPARTARHRAPCRPGTGR